jgi:hypothetical protein
MSDITGNESHKYREKPKNKHIGLLWELNPRPLAPKARIIPLDQTAVSTLFTVIFTHYNEKTRFSLFHNYKLAITVHFSPHTYFDSSESLALLLLAPSTSRILNLFDDGLMMGLNSVAAGGSVGGVLGRAFGLVLPDAFTLILNVTCGSTVALGGAGARRVYFTTFQNQGFPCS